MRKDREGSGPLSGGEMELLLEQALGLILIMPCLYIATLMLLSWAG